MEFDFSFVEALRRLGAGAVLRVVNEARPSSRYLFNSLLPERREPSYEAKSANMTVRTTMAGLVAMSSPYPPGGLVTGSTFSESIAKIANSVMLDEPALRKLQAMVAEMRLRGSVDPTDFLMREILNFVDKVIVQAHDDTKEYLRAQALVTGAINWTFNKKTLNVNYGVPAANILAARSGTDSWDGTTSKFWEDIKLLQERLHYNVRAYICHVDTAQAIIANDENNKIDILNMSEYSNGVQTFDIRRYRGSLERPETDARYRLRLIAYGEEAELLDPADLTTTVKVPFMTKGKILAVGRNTNRGFIAGEGGSRDPARDLALGYTHIGPTIENGGRTGPWGRVYTPEGRPWQVVGEAVTNVLPVIEAPEKIAVASSAIA